ncbi:MAG: phosphatidate cytidylyltransferase [Clostridia bacterium]|nr:phosphatidate cytidylyltransferase [Clostridia bacterium]
MRMGRVTTGLIMLAVMLVLWCVQGAPLRIALMLFTCLAVWEMYNALSVKGMRPRRWVGVTYAVLALPVYLMGGAVLLTPLTTVFCVLGLAVVLFRGEADFEAAVGTLFPIFYPGLMFTMLYPIQDLGNPLLSSLALGLTFLLPSVADVCAYEVGSRWGKHKMAPKLSPKKTMEGALAGMGGALLTSILLPLVFMLLSRWVEAFKPFAGTIPALWKFIPMGILAGFASIMGDLAASMVKRYCGIKDFGTLLPGHGGIMDRLDSVLFNGVVVFTFFLMVL